ncbi:MAG: bifunctional ADP-dependent NAD(P)H-hydrate dehydratase/NAD(P)H-hydrate epimerase [Treponema sp.]|nr:bifunctional ADP-dependent NAD(P)H-hydrate dehydratase/NAD(P)H-hydrate epimerase [Treponema sp.]
MITPCDQKADTRHILVHSDHSRAIDREAADWGLVSHALVEAAGRLCARYFIRQFPRFARAAGKGGDSAPVCVLAGSGNNAADALVMLRTLVLEGQIQVSAAHVFCTRMPPDDNRTPLRDAYRAVQKLGISCSVWNSVSNDVLARAGLIIDGIAGTGIQGPLAGTAAEMAEAVNKLRQAGKNPCIVSIDVPSGNFDGWKPGMIQLRADVTLAIEPEKLCLYTPASRPYAGQIISVGNLFPYALTEKYADAVLLNWKDSSAMIPPVEPDAYKYRRGVAEIWAGSPGASGAALLAARGAQASGAGIVRLIVDQPLLPLLAPGAGGIMVTAGPKDPDDGRFKPDAILAGPGWGRGQDRGALLQRFRELEGQGIPLILDADAITLARDIVFSGNTLITPHPAEFAAYTGSPIEDILADPIPILKKFSVEKNVHILLKGHVLYIASPPVYTGQRPNSAVQSPFPVAVIDGMNPVLACAGSGDVLAGFCAGLAGRMHAEKCLNLFSCAAAAASLLMEAGRSAAVANRFIDPLELAGAAADIAGAAWLNAEIRTETADSGKHHER